MSADIVVIIIFCVLGLAAHGARHQPWIEWVLRVICGFAFVAEVCTAFFGTAQHSDQMTPWSTGVTAVMAVLTGMILFRPCRVAISYALTGVNQLINGEVLAAFWPKESTYAPVFTELPDPSRPIAPPLPAPVESAKDEQSTKDAAAKVDAPGSVSDPIEDQTEAKENSSAISEVSADATPIDVPVDTANDRAPDSTKPAVSASEASASGSEGAGITNAPATADGTGANVSAESPASETGVAADSVVFASSETGASAEPVVTKPEPPRSRMWLAFFGDRVFMADSVPHLNAAFIYITVLGSLLASISLDSFKFPSIAFPFPVPLDSLFNYNFLGLVMLAICGAGIFVARKPKEVLKRLGIVKPEGWHIGVALICVCLTFLYDYLWSLYTNTPTAGIGSKLATYNAGTFSAGGGAGNAAVLALFTGICAGIGEETLIRGGLQPVFGIFPAAFLHGALHGQFQHAPLLIIQVAGWSTLMGIVRKYTNTTTTIITHGTYNFLTTFLFAFNP